MMQNDVGGEDPYERLKKIKYLGCKRFYQELNDLEILDTLGVDDWLKHLMPPIKSAEDQYVKRNDWKYLSLENILHQRPEMVYKFFQVVQECDVLPDQAKKLVKMMVRKLPEDLFYTNDEFRVDPPACAPKDRARNLMINKPRIETLGLWALEELRRKNVITLDEATEVSDKRKKDLFTVLYSNISEKWVKLLDVIKKVFEMTDLARCLQMTPPNAIRSEEEVSSICIEIPDLPSNYVRRTAYCQELERILDTWNGEDSGKILLKGDKDTGLTTLAIHAVRYAVRHLKVDKVVWRNCSGCYTADIHSEERTLLVLDAACCNIWSKARFAIVTSNEGIPERELKGVEVIQVKETFNREDCHTILLDTLDVSIAPPDTDPDQLLEDVTDDIMKVKNIGWSALCVAVAIVRDEAQQEGGGGMQLRDRLQGLDLQNQEPSHWKNLSDDLKACYKKLVLFCDTDARICVHSMASIWSDKKTSSDCEKQTRMRLSDFARKQLLVKSNIHEGCQTYRLTNSLKSFLRKQVPENRLLDMKREVVAKYRRRVPDVKDEFYYSHIVSLLVDTDQVKKAVELLTSLKFKEKRVESGTMGNFLRDFERANQKGGPDKNLHLHWAMAEVEVPAILASDDGRVLNHCAGLHLVDASCPKSSEASLRLHARHRFQNRPFLPKLRNGHVVRRSDAGCAKAFPKEEFFTHLDCSPDRKLIALCSNLHFIYLLDSCTFEIVCQRNIKMHVFFVHFLTDDRFLAVANNRLCYYDISEDRNSFKKTELGIEDWGLISQNICYEDNICMTMENFVRPVALQDNMLWVGKDNGVFVYSCENNGAMEVDKYLFREESVDSSFLATCQDGQLAVVCRNSVLWVLKLENAKLKCVLKEEAEHNVRAAAWIGRRLVFSTTGPSAEITIGDVDLDKPAFRSTHTLRISFSPNFALSCPTAEQVLFGEVGGRVAVFESRLACEHFLPLRRPHALAVPSGKGDSAQLLGAFEAQHVTVFEWPCSKEKGFAPVPTAMPIALTESFRRQRWNRHAPDSVVKICCVGTDDLAVVVHKRKITFVRLRDVHVLMQHLWPNDDDDEDALKKALCQVDAADGRILAVIATRKRCVQYNVHEKRFKDLGSLPANGVNECHFESLVLRGEKLLCSASCPESDDDQFYLLYMYVFEEKNWKNITSNTQITANHGVLIKDEHDVELLMLLPTKLKDTECPLYNLQEKHVNLFIGGVSKPVIFDVSSQAKRVAMVHQQRVAVYEFKANDTLRTVREMRFEGAASIYAVCFLPDSENLLSVVFAANAFSDLKLCVWDIAGMGSKDVFEIDIRNAITSFNFFEEQRLNSRLFWSLTMDTVLLLTERSLVNIDLKTLKSNLVLNSDWFLGTRGNHFDVHKSFASDKDICLVLDNAEMFWLQKNVKHTSSGRKKT